MSKQSMACPNCGKGTINFDVKELLSGASFTCTVCDRAVTIKSSTKKTPNKT